MYELTGRGNWVKALKVVFDDFSIESSIGASSPILSKNTFAFYRDSQFVMFNLNTSSATCDIADLLSLIDSTMVIYGFERYHTSMYTESMQLGYCIINRDVLQTKILDSKGNIKL